MKKKLRQFIKAFFLFLVSIVVLVAFIVAPIDRTPLEEQAFYKQTKQLLDTLNPLTFESKNTLKAGWATTNITPAHPMALAGYRPRSSYEAVHDSLYAHVLVINNGSATIALVTIDLLLFPAEMRDRLNERCLQKGFDFLYFGATHTHNGVGCWDKSMGGQLAMGDYDDAWVNETVDRLYTALMRAKSTLLQSIVSYGESNGSALVANRLTRGGFTENTIRLLRIHRADSSKGLFYTFAAHANSISKKSQMVSADYPGRVNQLLRDDGYDFSMYMAGMVGSHRTKYLNDYTLLNDFDLINVYSNELAKRIKLARYTSSIQDSTDIQFAVLPVSFGPSQLRISKDWRLRPWLFSALLSPLKGDITILQIGELTLLGTPCDFSGELYLQHFTKYHNDPIMITSFNGDYVGYITADERYETNTRTEVRNMNWVGPYHGKYFSELMLGLLEK